MDVILTAIAIWAAATVLTVVFVLAARRLGEN